MSTLPFFGPLRSMIVKNTRKEHNNITNPVRPFEPSREVKPAHPATPWVCGLPRPPYHWRATPPSLR